MSDFKSAISELWDKLMGYELQLVDQLEVSVSNYGISSLVLPFVFFFF